MGLGCFFSSVMTFLRCRTGFHEESRARWQSQSIHTHFFAIPSGGNRRCVRNPRANAGSVTRRRHTHTFAIPSGGDRRCVRCPRVRCKQVERESLIIGHERCRSCKAPQGAKGDGGKRRAKPARDIHRFREWRSSGAAPPRRMQVSACRVLTASVELIEGGVLRNG